jgi:hypothetical protein
VKELFSDVARAKLSMHNCSKVNHSVENDRIAACLEVAEWRVSWWCQVVWLMSFLNDAADSGGRFWWYSTTLEAIGILIPFLSVPREIAGMHVVLHVNIMALVYGCMNGNVKMI